MSEIAGYIESRTGARDTNMPTARGAGLEGIVATTSSICFIDGEAGVLSYEGYNIHTLADIAVFEEVI